MATSVVVEPTVRLLDQPKNRCEELDHHTPSIITREEIKGLIRVHVDGKVERHHVVPLAPPVGCTDIVIDSKTNLWARLYVPPRGSINNNNKKSNNSGPAIAYFHGGGFCVGSAAWACYHEFAGRLARETGRAVMSVEYRLAPESPLPAAYEDAARSVEWLLGQPLGRDGIVLAGDSAGANIVYNLLITTSSSAMIKGAVLIQPFFGGQDRTASEAKSISGGGALSLAASDTYWRMALPAGADRDHPCCNPLAPGTSLVTPGTSTAVMVCVSELDILRDRNLEFCVALLAAESKVRCEVYEGVGHAFQVLGRSSLAKQERANLMMEHIKDFISTC